MGRKVQIYQNIMLLAINEGLKNNYFGLDHSTLTNKEIVYYDLIYDDIPIYVEAYGIGHEEIRFDVYINWNNSKKHKILKNGGKYTYDIEMIGYLERKTDFYLMFCKRVSIAGLNKLAADKIANWDIEPNGYKKTGPFIL